MNRTMNFIGHESGRLADSVKVSGLPAQEYHSDLEVQSCSQLKQMLSSPAHFQAQFTEPNGASKAKDFGTLVHTLVLEPHRLALDYAVYPEKRDGRDTAFKAFVAAHPGQQVIDEVQLHEARTAAERLLGRRVSLNEKDKGRPFGDYLAESEREVCVYYTDPTTGVRCRTRFDVRHPEVILDVKTAAMIARATWLQSALKLHYDMQAYMYSLADCLYSGREHPRPFIFVVAESESPYSTSVFRAGESFMREGASKYARALSAFAACSRVDYWPDQGEDAVLEIEPWMSRANDQPGWHSALAL